MKDQEQRDKLLLQELKKGDEKAFREIYIHYHQQMHHTAKRYLRSNELAEDAVHDIFVILWNNRKKLDRSGSLRGFLFTALKNHVLNMVTHHKMELKKSIEITYEKKMNRKETENVFVLSEYRELYQVAVNQLPEKRKKVFDLRVSEGLTNSEVAEYLELSIHTVKSQYYKATQFIKEYVHTNMNSDTGS
jgi:RNA polymerase sigma-70 factor (ECF subfamily)